MKLWVILLLLCIMQISVSDETANVADILPSCSVIRDELTLSLGNIDRQAASVSLQLTDRKLGPDESHALLSSLTENNSAVVFAAIVSPDGVITMVTPDIYDPFVGSMVPVLSQEESIQIPVLKDSDSLQVPELQGGVLPVGKFLLWPYRTVNGTAHLLITIDTERLCTDTIERIGIDSELFSVIMDQNGTVLWTSDKIELMSVPPEGVLTEFPTFRDVKDLVLYSWTGQTIYDVWDSNGVVRNGAWSSMPFYSDIWKVFVAR